MSCDASFIHLHLKHQPGGALLTKVDINSLPGKEPGVGGPAAQPNLETLFKEKSTKLQVFFRYEMGIYKV